MKNENGDDPICRFSDGSYGYPSETKSSAETDDSPAMISTFSGLGESIINFIVESNLVHSDTQDPAILIWSGSAPEQIESRVKEFLSHGP